MENSIIKSYKEMAGEEAIDELYQLANMLKGVKVLHVSSTKAGGGVAEILHVMVSLMRSLGMEVEWEVIEGTPEFFECTKSFHNLLQGQKLGMPSTKYLKAYEEINKENGKMLLNAIENANIIFIHDPQPAALIKSFPQRKSKWIWRCHIDLSTPDRATWKYLYPFVKEYDASIFSMPDFAQILPHPCFIIPPSIDPLSEKNRDLDQEELNKTYTHFNLNPESPIILQVSRFDRFKDPLGVIKAYHLSKYIRDDIQLILAGGGASDDPEGEAVLEEVKKAANGDPRVHILFLPSDSHRTINALQRISTIIMQKSIKEGFGLTVTEALWKKKAVIGGDTGGIRLQVINGETGFLVHTPEGAANRMRALLQNPTLLTSMGEKGHAYVRNNFLITRHLRDYFSVMCSLLNRT